jgi:DNA-binding transcriptional MerR regulator
MAVDERSRLELHRRLEEVLGGGPAMTLMEHLPPGGGPSVATRSDVELLGERLGLRVDRLEERMDRLEERMDRLEERMDRLEERIDRLEGRLEGRLDHLGDRMDAFHHELRAQTRAFVFSTVGSMTAIAGVAFAAARLV